MKRFLLVFVALAASAGNECRTDTDCESGYTCEGSSGDSPGLCVPLPDDPNTGPRAACAMAR